MCADTYIALRSPLGSQKDHISDLEELYHYSSSYGIIFMVKIMHFWPKVHTRSTLYDRPSLTQKNFTKKFVDVSFGIANNSQIWENSLRAQRIVARLKSKMES